MRRLPFFLMLLGLFAGTADAQVFWRRPRATPSDWTRGFESTVRVQEGRGEVQVFGVEGSLAQIHHDLERRHGDALLWMPGEHMAWAMALEQGWLTRYLVQPQPEPDSYWVVTVRQRERDAGRPGQSPRRHQIRELPVFPGSQPSFFTLLEDNGMALELSHTHAPPDAVLDHLSAAMTSGGWQASPLNTGGMRMFLRRDQLAFLGATRGKDGQTRVVRLHKPLGVD